MKKLSTLFLFSALFTCAADAEVIDPLQADADQMIVGAQLIPAPAISDESKHSEVHLDKQNYFIDRTYWEGTVADHLNDVSPDTYCTFHLEDENPFILKGSRKKIVRNLPYRDVITYHNEGEYFPLVITKVSSVKNKDRKLVEVIYSLRLDHVNEKGLQMTGTPTGYLKCNRGFGLWLKGESLTIHNVLHQLGDRFELH